ncbi:MAG TPA: type II toxin-antitoxin system RelE/ParE family toxin [Gemmatimonadaceae bacterium]|jgi:proteic killer suppression protein|nr:type II toxin-antitoxin system RelE/ParE family toxin [Gemmatimonadaceae bacterium]
MKIESFGHKGLERLYAKDEDKGVPAGSRRKLRNILGFLEAMAGPQELVTPVLKWKAHRLGGNRKGSWALNVTGNWRLTFWIDEQNRLRDLNLEDYH